MDTTFVTGTGKSSKTLPSSFFKRYGPLGGKRGAKETLSPELIQKQKEMKETSEELEDARQKFELWNSDFQIKKQKIGEKQQVLAEQKKNLDQFSIHHNSELAKAKKKQETENELSQKIERDLQELSQEEDQLNKENNALNEALLKVTPIAEYLQAVVDSSHSFDNIEAILNRYNSLAKTRAEFLEKYHNLMEQFGTKQATLNAQLDHQQAHLIDATMQYNHKVKDVEQRHQENQYRKTNVIKIIQRSKEKHRELTAIKTSIRAIFERAVPEEKRPKDVNKMSEAQMLQFIENRFNDLKDIIQDPNVVYITPIPPPLPVGLPPATKPTNVRTRK